MGPTGIATYIQVPNQSPGPERSGSARGSRDWNRTATAMKIAFIHPDLGIGGAERLVIDAAVGLKQSGHEIVIYTSYRDKEHCFEEARDGTLEVRIRGDSIVPRNILGRFSILCAMLRQIHLAITLLWDADKYDAIFIDQLSAAIPILKYYRESTRILFYCHFPDKLLSMRTSTLKKIYRIPFDFIEGWTTGQADTIVVNSQFTANVFHEAFPMINLRPKVIHPCVDIEQSFSKAAVQTKRKIVLSINRFERKKNLHLAINAFSKLSSLPRFAEAVLVIAGGHDPRVTENTTYHTALVSSCSELGLTHKTLQSPYDLPLKFDDDINVYFLLSVPEQLKSSLLASSSILAYTPAQEHFGIVPVEAGLAGLPVVAQNNGGPLETVEDSLTGFLKADDPDAWSEIFKMCLFEQSEDERAQMSKEARDRVKERFSRETMIRALDEEFEDMLKRPSRSVSTGALVMVAIVLVLAWKFVFRPVIRPLILTSYDRYLDSYLQPVTQYFKHLFAYLTAIMQWALSRAAM